MIQLKYFVVLVALVCFSYAGVCQIAKPSKNIPAAEHYEGGQDAMYAFLQSQIKYPPVAKRNRIQGECIISFFIEKDGRATGFHLVKSLGGGCAEEALRVIQLLKFNAPGYRLQTSIPIIFKL